MQQSEEKKLSPFRERVVNALSLVEDVIYVGLGLLLAVYALALLMRGFFSFAHLLTGPASAAMLVSLLEEVLTVFLVVELLYTVQISFREHGLVTEPFLIVGLIAMIRHVLVVTAQFSELAMAEEAAFRHAAYEMMLLALMIVVLVGSLIFMRRQMQASGRSR